MQTFLPYDNFSRSAQVLDYRRLGKQRVEGWMIFQILVGEDPTSRWRHHPAVRMWKGYEFALGHYVLTMCREWVSRGYRDTCSRKLQDYWKLYGRCIANTPDPPWLGDSFFHESHQSNLIRKKPEFYGPKFPGVPNNLPYVWPV